METPIEKLLKQWCQYLVVYSAEHPYYIEVLDVLNDNGYSVYELEFSSQGSTTTVVAHGEEPVSFTIDFTVTKQDASSI